MSYRLISQSILLLLLTASGGAEATTTTCQRVELEPADVAVVASIDKMEKDAGSLFTILAWSPVIQIVTNDYPIGAVYTAATHDYEKHAKAVNSIGNIASCSISTVIALHSADLQGCRKDFFDSLQREYLNNCN